MAMLKVAHVTVYTWAWTCSWSQLACSKGRQPPVQCALFCINHLNWVNSLNGSAMMTAS